MIKCNFYFFSNRDSFLREMCVLFNLLYFKYYQNQGFFLNLLMHLLMQELFGLKVRGNLSCRMPRQDWTPDNLAHRF